MKYKILGKQNNTDKCFVCGMMNEAGVKAEFYNCQDEQGEKVLLTRITPQDIHQSYPNRMHGGVISALLDESIGRAVQIDNADIWAVTIDLNVKFRKPVSLDTIIWIESKITNLGARAFEGEGKMFLSRDGEQITLATATAKFFRVSYDDAFPTDKLNPKNWFVVAEDLPEYFEL